jgi:hypothetical protein
MMKAFAPLLALAVGLAFTLTPTPAQALGPDGKARTAKQCFDYKAEYDRNNCAKCFAKGGKRLYKIGNPKGKRCESAGPPKITKAKQCFSFKADYDRSNCAKCFAKGGKRYQISNPKGKRCVK